MLGLFTFFYACVHLSMWVGLDWFFDWSAMGKEIVKHKYILVGMLTFVILLPLALTSTRGWVRRLGKRWVKLHRLIYVAAVTGTIHYLWAVKKDTLFPLLYLGAFVLLLGYRVIAARVHRREVAMRSRLTTLCCLLSVAAAGEARAQAGVLGGWVSSDSAARKMIPAGDVSIPALGLTTRSNMYGEYRLEGIAAGRHLVMVQASGYKSVGDSVTIAATGVTYHDFVLLNRAIVLDSVVTTAPATKATFISPGLRGAEERSQQGFGHFIKEDELRRHDHDRLSSVVLQKIPGVVLSRGPGGAVFLASTRKLSSGSVLSANATAGLKCYVTIYTDGVLTYSYAMSAPERRPKSMAALDPPDLNQISIIEYAMIEFYAGGSTYPPWISPTNNDCGVLLLWTRER